VPGSASSRGTTGRRVRVARRVVGRAHRPGGRTRSAGWSGVGARAGL